MKGLIPIIREIRAELYSDEAFQVYSACMYRPSFEKYTARIDAYLADPEVRAFGAFDSGRLCGVIIVRQGEILGISTLPRGQGMGRRLIQHARSLNNTLTAETDDDAVNFYRVCGFSCEAFERTFPDGTYIRYRCELKNI